ncbi:hypothetical protein NQ314_002821 [Rhamnusium bicolor]|uniref:Uncharacterized protein n=1 Tax=Rhamnusium bicolor TaxID=1586634 RepID=A0AAV8ZNF6_9CUCU|nr:hypothetical protein NQ314_002821 [Rhamnusium bicolor]
MPLKLPDNFIKERYESDQKYIFVYDTYRPDFTKTAVTAKFYSKYEGDVDEPDPVMLEKFKRAKALGPKDKRLWPETTNQWFLYNFVKST